MLRLLGLGLAGAAAFAGVYAATAPGPLPRPQPALAMASSVAPAGQENVRNVTPDILTAAPLMLSPLVRVEPAPEPARADPPQLPIERIGRPIVEAAGLLKVGPRILRLGGIDGPAVDAVCGSDAAWPCGRMARAALQRYLRGRSVECAVRPEDEPVAALPEEADCTVGGSDIALWLVTEGWAKPAGRFEAAAEAARRAGKGLWSATRPDIAAPRTVQAAPASSPDSAIDMSLRVSSMP